MTKNREIELILNAVPTLEGAGVKLKRVFGHAETKIMDPFLLLDHFGSENPDDYIKGFPWHPHRGIETVTYMINGIVEHGDSLKNQGVIQSGDVQWMSAGSGIIHQEMPKPYSGSMMGFQLWVNLPADLKMSKPRYQGILSSQIPVYQEKNLVIKVIAGNYKDIYGPVKDISIDPLYLDIYLEKETRFEFDLKKDQTAFIYVFNGECFAGETMKEVKKEQLGYFTFGDCLTIKTAEKSCRMILVSGRPIGEPIAWYGPIVMNTQDELQKAFEELEDGTFIKNG